MNGKQKLKQTLSKFGIKLNAAVWGDKPPKDFEEWLGRQPIAKEHPADEFDRLTQQGWKFNLITGEYERQ